MWYSMVYEGHVKDQPAGLAAAGVIFVDPLIISVFFQGSAWNTGNGGRGRMCSKAAGATTGSWQAYFHLENRKHTDVLLQVKSKWKGLWEILEHSGRLLHWYIYIEILNVSCLGTVKWATCMIFVFWKFRWLLQYFFRGRRNIFYGNYASIQKTKTSVACTQAKWEKDCVQRHVAPNSVTIGRKFFRCSLHFIVDLTNHSWWHLIWSAGQLTRDPQIKGLMLY